jgi:molybdopterin/thiamine biosynthesis adenylyltransferase
MKLGVLPYRYVRNRISLSLADQLRLAGSRVTVLGAGGLGGQVISLLARVGVGMIVIVDKDMFDETNLNRQALSTTASIGKLKSEEAARVVAAINPAVRTECTVVEIKRSNCEKILRGADVIVDCLDSISVRLLAQDSAKALGVPLVHGAVGGFEGQLTTIFPEDEGLKLIYGGSEGEGDIRQRAESILGATAHAACLVGTFQAMEVLKILLKRGKIFRNILLHMDLETGEVDQFDL